MAGRETGFRGGAFNQEWKEDAGGVVAIAAVAGSGRGRMGGGRRAKRLRPRVRVMALDCGAKSKHSAEPGGTGVRRGGGAARHITGGADRGYVQERAERGAVIRNGNGDPRRWRRRIKALREVSGRGRRWCVADVRDTALGTQLLVGAGCDGRSSSVFFGASGGESDGEDLDTGGWKITSQNQGLRGQGITQAVGGEGEARHLNDMIAAGFQVDGAAGVAACSITEESPGQMIRRIVGIVRADDGDKKPTLVWGGEAEREAR